MKEDRRVNLLVGISTACGVIALIAFLYNLIGATPGEATAAWGAIIASLIGGAIAGYAAYLGVRTTIEGQAKTEKEKFAAELLSIRTALHTEVAMIGMQCLLEYRAWYEAFTKNQSKSPRTARLPTLIVYRSVTAKIGLLRREEIMPLIGFDGTLHDAHVVAAGMNPDLTTIADRKTLAVLFSHACRNAADFLDAVRDIPASEGDKAADRRFVAALRDASRLGLEERARAQAANP